MRKFILNKVIRSKLLDRMHQDKTEVDSVVLEGDEAFEAVLSKLIEEATEALKAPMEDRAKELADLKTALEDAITLSGVSAEEVNAHLERIANERGRFIPTIFVRTVNVQDDDPMGDYYASDPDRFTEVTPEEA